MGNNKVFLTFIIGIVMLLLTIPFILADPDIDISSSRDANTDEGLNSCQIRNAVNHGDLTLYKSDNFVKTPLFGGILFVPLKVFGTSLLIGRLTVFLLSLAICLHIVGSNSYYTIFGGFSLIIVFCQYYVFHYFHFCLSEMLSTVLIFLSIFFQVESYISKTYLKPALLSATCLSIVYFLKIQFIYSIFILPFSILIFMLQKSTDKKLLIMQLLYTSLFLLIYLAIYFVVWYLPNKDFYDYVMANQTTDRFVSIQNLSNHLQFILNNIFYSTYLKLYTISFYIAFLSGLIYLFFTESIRYKFLFIGLSCWILVELHKLSMTYLPSRYLVSLYFAMGLLISLVLFEFISTKTKKPLVYMAKGVSFLLLITIGIKNSIDYSSSLKRRTFVISEINSYLGKYNFQNRPVIGAWAPSLSWESKAISFPVWKDYFNDKDVINTYNPAVIIAETDEEDSNQAFSSQGVDVGTYADSIKYFTINKWKLKLIWINQSRHNPVNYK